MRVEHLDADGAVLLTEHVPGGDVATGFDDDQPWPVDGLRLTAVLSQAGPTRLGV